MAVLWLRSLSRSLTLQAPSSLFQTWQFNAHAAEMARYAGRAKQHAEGRSGRHMLIWSLLLVLFANRAGGGAIRQVLNRGLSMAFEKLQSTAAEVARQQSMMQGVLDQVHRQALSSTLGVMN